MFQILNQPSLTQINGPHWASIRTVKGWGSAEAANSSADDSYSANSESFGVLHIRLTGIYHNLLRRWAEV